MYEKIKNIGKKLIPKNILKKNKSFLRIVVASFYKGNNYECNVCGFKLSKFIELKNKERICPKCGSLPRTRRLWEVINEQIEIKQKEILHFSPSKSLQTKIRRLNAKEYTTTDYAGEFDAKKKFNIEAIDEVDEKYDLIICYHILEHIENDSQAMQELFRILKKDGKCIIQTPFKEGEIFEDKKIKTKEERTLHFGQDDHVRIYSAKGLTNRLEAVGFKTDLQIYNSTSENKYGFRTNETIIIATKVA